MAGAAGTWADLTSVLGSGGELVNGIEDGDGHTTAEVGLDVAVEEPRAGGVGLVAEDHPGTCTLVGGGE